MDATQVGIMQHEATWSVLVHVKRFILRTLHDLRARAAPGGEVWRNAVAMMGRWGRVTLADHMTAPQWSDAYRTMATHFAIATCPHRIEGGKTRIPSQNLFLEAVTRSTSMSPRLLDGTVVDLPSAEQDRIVADNIRTALGDMFNRLEADPAGPPPPVAAAESSEGTRTTPPPAPPPSCRPTPPTPLLPSDSVSMAPPPPADTGEEQEEDVAEEQQMSRDLNALTSGSCFFSLSRTGKQGDADARLERPAGGGTGHGDRPELCAPESVAQTAAGWQ
jgi:hypothetical protein